MDKLPIPPIQRTVMDRPLSVRLSLRQRRELDLASVISGFPTTSAFVREIMKNVTAGVLKAA